ncbi:MAG: NTP transferase domain-containing protein [Desulfobulbus sp.]|jgi:CTP:molybdopterin cytidylyltransferase MocA|nr:NTP transferase domain-containing protein [Desulfobulbus sp.]
MTPRLSGVVLAAGLSSRMGTLKPLLPLDPEALRTPLGLCLDLFHGSHINEVVVVTGHRREEVSAAARAAGARVVHNRDFARGMYTSIRAGVAGLRENTDGFFLLPVDIPLVRCGTVRLLTQAFTQEPASVLHPVFAGRRGHPPLIAAELIPRICDQEEPAGGLRTLLAWVEADQPGQVREIQVADRFIHLDMDTPAEHAACVQQFVRRDWPSLVEAEAILTHLHPMSTKGLAHGRRVGEVAALLAERLILATGRPLEVELCRVSGLLHDLAKEQPDHEEEGARWLRDLGFPRAAAIVAAHRDMTWHPDMGLGEREIVHLADKLVRGSRIVPVRARFEEKLALYQHDPEAIHAIKGRRRLAEQVATAIEAALGQPLATLLPTDEQP